MLGTAVLGSVLSTIYARSLTLSDGLTPGQEHQASETLGGAVEVANTLPDVSAAPLFDAGK